MVRGPPGPSKMRALRSAGYVLCATLVASSQMWGVSATQQDTELQHEVDAANWAVVVRQSVNPDRQAGRVASFWVGLKNNGDRERLVCVESLSYSIIASDNGVGGYVEGGPRKAPRACEVPADMRLVLPGETLFEFAMVPLPEWVVDGQEIGFLVSAVGRPSNQWLSREWVFEKGAWQLCLPDYDTTTHTEGVQKHPPRDAGRRNGSQSGYDDQGRVRLVEDAAAGVLNYEYGVVSRMIGGPNLSKTQDGAANPG